MKTARSILWSSLLVGLLAACRGEDSLAPERTARLTADFPVSEQFSVLEAPGSAPDARIERAADGLRHLYSHATVQIEEERARTTVSDVFVNDGSAAQPLVYRFPLPGDATIVSVVEVVEGQRRVASAAEKGAAKRELERAEREGERGSLTEQDGTGFSMRFSSVAPGDTRRVELTYVQTLSSLGAEHSYVFPHLHVDRSRPRLFEFAARIVTHAKLRELTALNHEDARIQRPSAQTASVRMQRLNRALGQDVVLRFSEESAPLELSGRSAVGGGEGFFEARFAFTADPYAAAAPARDVVIVVDGSLSMAGEPLETARRTAREVVRGLSPRDRVALVTFDERLRSDSALTPASEAVKLGLEQSLQALTPRGGSNLDAAIDRAAELLKPSKQAVLLFLTDGQSTVGAGDVDTLTPTAKAEDFAHVSTIIGLFNYPARQAALQAVFPKSTLRYVPNGRVAEQAAHELSGLATAPVLEHVKVAIQGAKSGSVVQSASDRLLLGDALRIHGQTAGSVKIDIQGTLHGHGFSRTLSLTPEKDDARKATLALDWARARVHELEDRYRAKESQELHDEIVALGTKHSIATMFTSFVATDSLGPDRVMPGDPEIRVRAARSAQAVFAELPWGETVHCTYSEDEGLWLGRFLVPRSLGDDVYRVRVYVTSQDLTRLRSTLYVRVDSKPPRFALSVRREANAWLLEARPVGDVYDAEGDSIRPDAIDVRSVTVRIDDGTPLELTEKAGVWSARLSDLPVGSHRAQLSASDQASNVSNSSSTFTVSP